MGRSRASKESSKESEKVPDGWRHFKELTSHGSAIVPDRRVRSKIVISHESYLEYRTRFKKHDTDMLKSYKAILKSDVAAWQAWMNGINDLKYAFVGAVSGAVIPLLISSFIY